MAVVLVIPTTLKGRLLAALTALALLFVLERLLVGSIVYSLQEKHCRRAIQCLRESERVETCEKIREELCIQRSSVTFWSHIATGGLVIALGILGLRLAATRRHRELG